MARSPTPRSTRQDLVCLLALCSVTFILGLTSHGLTNWQEAMRALVGRTMGLGADGAPGGPAEWIVPSINGEPYLAKPPMIYWCQLALARARVPFGGDGVPGLVELRLTVALAGTLGVLATYVVTRRLFGATDGERRADPLHAPTHATTLDAFGSHAAWWSSLFLATGILYTRSARTGELDILLAPATVIAIGAIHAAWISHIERRRTHWGALTIAGLAVAAAALTKGPPGVVTVLLGAYGGIAFAVAAAARADADSREGPRSALGAALGAVALGLPTSLHIEKPADVLGTLLVASAGAVIGAALAPLTRPKPFRTLFGAYARTHPVGMILIAATSVYAWSRLVASRIGAEALARAATTETDANLVLFDPESILENLGAASYAVGIGSLLAVSGAIWIITKRPQATRAGPGGFGGGGSGLYVVIAWIGLGLLAFSLLGKGVARYMTPLWPGIAMLGGVLFTTALKAFQHRAFAVRVRLVAALAVLGLAIGQGLWYGVARERLYAHRHPRAMIEELAALSPAQPPLVLDFWTPALDYYAGIHIQPVDDVGPWERVAGVHPWSLDTLRAELSRTRGSRLMLIRAVPHRRTIQTAPIERLREAGFVAEPVDVSARFVIDNNRTPVAVVRVSVAR
jgi:4-amino-4-deoxy-L-arabinose transferase-like glycosyltransferase